MRRRGCETSPFFVYAWGTARSVVCVSVSTYLRSEGVARQAGRTRAGRPRRKREGFRRGPPGRNRITERVRGIAPGGDDCQNRAARRYEKCSYLWHYFRRFEPFRPSLPPPPPPTRLANRSPVPLFLPPPSPVPHPPPRSSSLRSPTAAVVSRNARRFLLPLLGSSLRSSVPSFHPSTSSFVIPT